MSNSPNDSNNPRQVFFGPAGLRIRFHLRNVDDLTSPPSPSHQLCQLDEVEEI